MLETARITAQLLATARYLAAANVAVFLLGAQAGGGWAVVHAAAAAVLLYLHVRLAFDRRVFRDFSDRHYGPEAFDAVLSRLGLRKASGSRAMEERTAGAVRLWKRAVCASAVQLALFLLQNCAAAVS